MDVTRGLRLDVAFGREAGKLPDRDRAFVHEWVYGLSRLQGRVDHLVDRKLRGPADRIEPEVREILRLGAYQVLYMGGVPSYAAVSQAVSLTRDIAGKGAAGLVNAVLRAVGEASDDLSLFPDSERDPAGFLASWGSHPRWLVDRWLARWSEEEVRALVEANNRAPELHVVPLGVDPDDAVARLAEKGIVGRTVGMGSRCVRLDTGTDPRTALGVLPSIVQDPAANLVVQYASVDRGMKIADLCAAPGGKALALSVGATYTLAADRSETRMRIVQDNVRRTLGSEEAGADRMAGPRSEARVGLAVADARHPPVRAVDAVLLDVPCTGTGTFRRHPDGRWRLRPESLEEMVLLQRDLLDAAAALPTPGGLLIYSTCSLEAEENQGQVDAFLRRRPDFRLERGPGDGVPEKYVTPSGALEVLPHRSTFDGSFAARLRRVA